MYFCYHHTYDSVWTWMRYGWNLCLVKIFLYTFLYIFSASSDNTGTIVASVVVVIVLLVLLTALLVFYLKTKHKANALIQESNVSQINCVGFGNDTYESGNAVSYIWSYFVLKGFFTPPPFNSKPVLHFCCGDQKDAFYVCFTLNVLIVWLKKSCLKAWEVT